VQNIEELGVSARRSPDSRGRIFSECQGCPTARGHRSGSRFNATRCAAFPHVCTESAPRSSNFGSSIPCPLMPLSTLRRSPQNQDGSLLPSC